MYFDYGFSSKFLCSESSRNETLQRPLHPLPTHHPTWRRVLQKTSSLHSAGRLYLALNNLNFIRIRKRAISSRSRKNLQSDFLYQRRQYLSTSFPPPSQGKVPGNEVAMKLKWRLSSTSKDELSL